MARPTDSTATEFSAIELVRVVSLTEAARLLNISTDGLRRHHAHLIRRMSPRRIGMRLRDVLDIGNNTA
jgi:hypothetical protein